MKIEIWNRCCECGRFISYDDFCNDKAGFFVTLDQYGNEQYEGLCKDHYDDSPANKEI